MSMNHHTPVPAPRPLCAVFKPQLGLLVFGLLDPDQEAALRTHLADCDYCQLHLREYEIVRRALYQHVGAEPSASADLAPRPPSAPVRSTRQRPPAEETSPHFTLEDIVKADQDETAATATREPPKPPSPLALARNKRLTALGAIAAVLVLTVLAASLFAYFGSRGTAPAVKPTPTRGLDPQSQAYVNVLETYYQPLGQTYDREQTCNENEALSTVSDKTSIMQSCQLLEGTVVDDVNAFASHLTLQPPTRWKTADSQLKQANQAMVASFSARLKATIPSQWEALEYPEDTAEQQYCAPIKQINGDLLTAGLPLTSQLPLPIHVALCPGG